MPLGLLLLGGGLIFGYAAGMLMGISRGKEAVIRRARMLMVRGKMDFSIDPILRGRTPGD
jgi:hypothetical protein